MFAAMRWNDKQGCGCHAQRGRRVVRAAGPLAYFGSDAIRHRRLPSVAVGGTPSHAQRGRRVVRASRVSPNAPTTLPARRDCAVGGTHRQNKTCFAPADRSRSMAPPYVASAYYDAPTGSFFSSAFFSSARAARRESLIRPVSSTLITFTLMRSPSLTSSLTDFT